MCGHLRLHFQARVSVCVRVPVLLMCAYVSCVCTSALWQGQVELGLGGGREGGRDCMWRRENHSSLLNLQNFISDNAGRPRS